MLLKIELLHIEKDISSFIFSFIEINSWKFLKLLKFGKMVKFYFFNKGFSNIKRLIKRIYKKEIE